MHLNEYIKHAVVSRGLRLMVKVIYVNLVPFPCAAVISSFTVALSKVLNCGLLEGPSLHRLPALHKISLLNDSLTSLLL